MRRYATAMFVCVLLMPRVFYAEDKKVGLDYKLPTSDKQGIDCKGWSYGCKVLIAWMKGKDKVQDLDQDTVDKIDAACRTLEGNGNACKTSGDAWEDDLKEIRDNLGLRHRIESTTSLTAERWVTYLCSRGPVLIVVADGQDKNKAILLRAIKDKGAAGQPPLLRFTWRASTDEADTVDQTFEQLQAVLPTGNTTIIFAP